MAQFAANFSIQKGALRGHINKPEMSSDLDILFPAIPI
jgi:hypothetical protein